MPTKYNIPKKRRTVRTIKMKNGSVLTAEADDSTNKLYWFKDGKYITPSVMKNYAFYDDKVKSKRRLDAYPQMRYQAGKAEVSGADTPVYTPTLDYLHEQQRNKEAAAIVAEREQAIPWTGNILTLRTPGNMNLVDIPTSLLDSIAVNSGRSKTPIRQNLGLIGKESTFGGYSHFLGRENEDSRGLNSHMLTNNHAYFKSPEEDFLAASLQRYGDSEQGLIAAEKDAEWNLRNNNIVDRTPHYSHYIMADAFRRYATAPEKYNPGQKNYVPMVNAIANEVWNEPQIQQWWNTQGKAQYERGQKEGMAYGGHIEYPNWNSLPMAERADVMKLAVENGIHDLDTVRSAYNEFAEGGRIHIKPSHRGRLTELKERTGKTEAELYNDGNPAHKKMVVFARNSRKWEHGLGGYLYPDGGYVREVNGHPIAFDYEGNLIDQVTGEKGYMPLPEVSVTANPDDVARGRAQRWYRDFGIESNDATSVVDGRRQNSHLDEWGIEGAAKAAAWAKDHPVLNNVGLGLSAIPFGVAAAPAVVGGGELAATALANPYVDAALTSMGGAHAAQSLANGEANWMTALELAPLGRLARPLYEGVVQPSMRLFNSPLTGNWTKIGNREYRLSPNSLGANGSPIESRGITPQITAENAASVTPEQWNAAYRAAYEAGDKAEGQRLWDLWFKKQAPDTQIVDEAGNPIHAYHGTGKHFNEFDTTGKYSTLDEGYYGVGAYFAPNKELAQMYADTERTPVMYDTYLNIKNPLRHVRDENADLYGKAIVDNDGVISTLPDNLVDETFDMTEFVATKPNQIKLAEPFTTADDGSLIDLTRRANFNINDIRYGLLPFLGLGTAATLYGRSNE